MDLEKKDFKEQIKTHSPVKLFLFGDQKGMDFRGLLACHVITVTLESEINWQQFCFERIFLQYESGAGGQQPVVM